MNTPKKHAETRFALPYETFDGLLQTVGLRLHEADEFSVEVRHEVGETPGELRPELRLESFDAAEFCERSGYGKQDVRLLVTVSSRERRETLTAYDERGVHRIPRCVQLWRIYELPMDWQGTFDISVRLVYHPGESTERRVGKAWREGQTLARKDFVIAAARRAPTIPVERATRKTFEEFGLPPDTSCWFDLADPDASDPGEAARFLVHEDIYDWLASPSVQPTPLAKLVTRWLAVEMIAAALVSITDRDEAEATGDEIPEAFRPLIARLSARSGIPSSDLLARFRRDRLYASAAAQQALDLTRNMARLLAEGR